MTTAVIPAKAGRMTIRTLAEKSENKKQRQNGFRFAGMTNENQIRRGSWKRTPPTVGTGRDPGQAMACSATPNANPPALVFFTNPYGGALIDLQDARILCADAPWRNGRSGAYCGVVEKVPERAKGNPIKAPPLPPLDRGARKSKPPLSGRQKNPPDKRAKAKPPLPGGGASPFYTPLSRGGRGGWFRRGKSGVRAKAVFPLKATSPDEDFPNNPFPGRRNYARSPPAGRPHPSQRNAFMGRCAGSGTPPG